MSDFSYITLESSFIPKHSLEYFQVPFLRYPIFHKLYPTIIALLVCFDCRCGAYDGMHFICRHPRLMRMVVRSSRQIAMGIALPPNQPNGCQTYVQTVLLTELAATD